MEKIIRIVGLFFFFGVLTWAALANGGDWEYYFDPKSLMVIVITAGGLTLMKYRKGADLFYLLRSLKLYLIICGIIVSIIGFIIIMFNTSEPAFIGPALAVASLSIVYSLILAGLVDTYIPQKHITS